MEEKSRKERAALYCRVSTEEQARYGLSLAEQEHSLKEYAASHDMAVIGIYIDAGISARKRYTKRPELLRLLSDVEADKIDTILFIKLDRWFRDVGQYYEVERILEAHNVTWRATQEDYETVTANGRFKVNIMLSVAQDEADRTSERIRFIFNGKRERGEPTGGRPPKGYKWQDKRLVLDTETAPIIRKAFDRYLECGSIAKVAREFPELHLSYTSAAYMFTNPVYTGDYHGISVPAIITADEQQTIIERRRSGIRETKHHHVYLFSGFLSCPVCGMRMSAMTAGGYNYYDCRSHYKDYDCQNKKLYREDRIEDYLLTHIDSEIAALVTSEAAQKGRSYQSQRDSINRKLTRLSELYINGLIAIDDYKRQYDALNAELAAIPPDEKPIDEGRIKTTFFPDWQSIYKALPKEEQQAFWRYSLKSLAVDVDGNVSFSLR